MVEAIRLYSDNPRFFEGERARIFACSRLFAGDEQYGTILPGHDQVAGFFRMRGEARVEAAERSAATTANAEASEKA